MNSVLKALQEYFQNNSAEQISKDWAETEKYDIVGPTIDDFMFQSKIFYETEIRQSYWEFNCQNETIENPKFASDFFFILATNFLIY